MLLLRIFLFIQFSGLALSLRAMDVVELPQPSSGAFIDAVLSKSSSDVSTFLSDKINLDNQFTLGSVALQIADKQQSVEIINILLKTMTPQQILDYLRFNFDPITSVNKHGDAVIHVATLLIHKFPEKAGLLDLLIAAGADINAKNLTTGLTPLHLAVYAQDRALIRLLQAKGANDQIRDKKGVTARALQTRANILRAGELFEQLEEKRKTKK